MFKRLRAEKALVLSRGATAVDRDLVGVSQNGADREDGPILEDVAPASGDLLDQRVLMQNSKRLVFDGWSEDDFLPRVNTSQKYGRAGRIEPLWYHPQHGSTNAAAQVVLRCNFDVKSLGRVS